MIDPGSRRALARVACGEPPRVLDLFAGAGGLSLGFQRAGFRIDGAVEIDPLAARTHARNFHPGDLARHGLARDITRLEPEELGLDAVDVLVGGPPCQAYARVGRAKLREMADHPSAFKVDPRGNLYLRYLAWVKALRPLALLVENVPDILHYGHHNVVEEMVDALDGLGYNSRYSLINSVFHGCPQMRDRVFLLAYRKELGATPRFPGRRGSCGCRAAMRGLARSPCGMWIDPVRPAISPPIPETHVYLGRSRRARRSAICRRSAGIRSGGARDGFRNFRPMPRRTISRST
jgi:DNA (cytosine-5)-methyltransferase 1